MFWLVWLYHPRVFLRSPPKAVDDPGGLFLHAPPGTRKEESTRSGCGRHKAFNTPIKTRRFGLSVSPLLCRAMGKATTSWSCHRASERVIQCFLSYHTARRPLPHSDKCGSSWAKDAHKGCIPTLFQELSVPENCKAATDVLQATCFY